MGVTFFDNARGYGDGFSETVYGKALKPHRKSIFLTTKTAQRSRAGAEAELAASLRAFQTDYVDLWQIHSIMKPVDLEQIFAPGGAIEAFVAAKKAGKARFIGFTGHHDPEVHARMLEMFEFDTILMPLHCADPHYLSFEKRVLGRAAEKGLGIQAMKVLANAKLLQSLTVDQCISYVLALPIHTAVLGATTPGQVDDTIRVAKAFQRLKPEEAQSLADKVKRIMGPDLEDWKRRV
jgi:aryl-alcohol dehydrogenase-like predicted oxidoreductase